MQIIEERRASTHRSRDPHGGLREWLRLLDAVLTAIEEIVWDLRERGGTAWEDLAGTPPKVRRLTATGWCLTKIAASYRLHVTRAAFVSRRRAAAQLDRLHDKNARRFYELSAQHGGAFLKVGQLLSARADLLPEAWIRELSRLQDRAPTLTPEVVRSTLEEAYGQPLERVFGSFEEAPIAAASIGQVHRASTRDGRDVAVKVQRPDIAALVRDDLDLLEACLDSLKRSLPPADYDTIVAEVRAMVEAEVDYGRELEMMQRLEGFFRSDALDGISAPVAVPELCTERVLVSTFAQGRKITDALDALREAGDDERLALVLGRLLEAYVSQVFEAGVFQADPHPGNFLVTEDDTLVVLDFGCVKELSAETRDLYLALVQAALLSDRASVVERLAQLGFRTRSGRPDTLERFAEVMLRDFRAAAASGEMRFADGEATLRQLRQLLDAAEGDPVIQVPEHFVMLGRVFGTLAGLFSHYQPKIDYARHVLPAFTRAALR